MFSCYIVLVVSLMDSLCCLHVCSCDYSCTDYPVFTPSRLVVKYGDPAKVTCAPCQKDCDENASGLEYPVGKVTTNGTTLLWSVDGLTEWDIFITCYYNTDAQCCSSLDLTLYQPPESASISAVNHTGPMFEHRQYSLQCSVQQVAPVQHLTVTFYRGHTALRQLRSNSAEKKPVNETFTLDITASREDDGAQYWCEAKLELGLDGPERPPLVTSERLTATVYSSAANPIKLIIRGTGLSLLVVTIGLTLWFRRYKAERAAAT